MIHNRRSNRTYVWIIYRRNRGGFDSIGFKELVDAGVKRYSFGI